MTGIGGLISRGGLMSRGGVMSRGQSRQRELQQRAEDLGILCSGLFGDPKEDPFLSLVVQVGLQVGLRVRLQGH